MTLQAESQENINLNTQTVNQLLEQTDLFLKLPNASTDRQEAILNLKAALKAVLPYLAEPKNKQTDEVALENDIRKEIIIAGANENG